MHARGAGRTRVTWRSPPPLRPPPSCGGEEEFGEGSHPHNCMLIRALSSYKKHCMTMTTSNKGEGAGTANARRQSTGRGR